MTGQVIKEGHRRWSLKKNMHLKHRMTTPVEWCIRFHRGFFGYFKTVFAPHSPTEDTARSDFNQDIPMAEISPEIMDRESAPDLVSTHNFDTSGLRL